MSRKWQISLRKNHSRFSYQSRQLKSIIKKLMEAKDWPEVPEGINSLSILLCSDSYIHKLNKEYRNKDKSTDVLSFSQLEEQQFIVSPELGDILISLDTAARQAKEYKHSLNHELLRLSIHAILHLMGYDHVAVSKSEANRMRRLERKFFDEYSSLLD